ncbi:MAG: leucyl aminopeptidase [Longimicrobiales bacterium]|nr:leucyl aminopeptidase [Longimicrobiales bacterium]
MNVRAASEDLLEQETPLLAIPIFREGEELSPFAARVDDALGGALGRARAAGDLSGRDGVTELFHRPEGVGGPERILAVGVGKKEAYDAEAVRKFAGRVVRFAEERRLKTLSVAVEAAGDLEIGDAAGAAAEGVVLAAWRFRELKTGAGEEDDSPIQVEEVVIGGSGDGPADTTAVDEGVRIGGAQARGENLARTLQQHPGNLMTPTVLAEKAREMSEEMGLEYRVLGPEEMEEEEMGALLAVARGSEEEPRLIIMEHRGGKEGDAPLILVGKGLTFDAGGISIKPSSGMEDMKFDMSGGAAVIGAMRAVAELGIPLNVVGIVPSSENLPSGSAVKPGDVVRTREGKTVEVINTDAEGRLILSDALSYAQGWNPAAMVDCATLTGSCVVALGHRASAVMGNDDDLVEELRAAGDRSGERCWPLPLWKEYRKQLDSETADLKNVGGRPAGSITAGKFLQEFVGEARWAHLDIAGTAYGDDPPPYLRKGAYGVPTRLLVEWVRSRSG